MNPTFEYWLDIGRTNGQFTLHRRLMNRPEHDMVKEYTYIKNVGRVYAEACARADEYIANMHTDDYGFDFIKFYDASEGGELRHPGEYDDTRFWFGKYADKLIEDVLCDDPDYCMYIRDNFFSNKPRMNSLIQKFKDMDLGKSKAEIEQERRDAEKAEREANKKPIPTELLEGRHTFTGTVVFTKYQESMYGGSEKMLFVDDRGFNLWGTAPSALWDASNESPSGCKIQFDATVQVSDDDECFGFFKRPTKVVVTEESEKRQADIDKWNKIHEAQASQTCEETS
jgi:hypothetical protein